MVEISTNGLKTLWEKKKLLVKCNFYFSPSVFKRLVQQTHKNQGLFGKGLILSNNKKIDGVRGREVELWPHNLEVRSSIPGSGCQLQDFFIGPHIRREYWCSSQEAESREVSISCKNLFLNWYKISIFKLKILTLYQTILWLLILQKKRLEIINPQWSISDKSRAP